ncbi:MAG: UDP-N-acetylglucosamine--LPS N-acetylglucosamine transferase [Thermodesulfobacteriota bacterium]
MLAVSSGGGHWVQLLRLRPAYQDQDIAFATVNSDYQQDVTQHRFFLINDATRWDKMALLILAFRLLFIFIRFRPQVVISTGAACGYFAIRLGKLFGATTIWVDSIANVEEMSLTGQLVGRHADLWLTQWPELAQPQGPYFHGGVL